MYWFKIQFRSQLPKYAAFKLWKTNETEHKFDAKKKFSDKIEGFNPFTLNRRIQSFSVLLVCFFLSFSLKYCHSHTMLMYRQRLYRWFFLRFFVCCCCCLTIKLSCLSCRSWWTGINVPIHLTMFHLLLHTFHEMTENVGCCWSLFQFC